MRANVFFDKLGAPPLPGSLQEAVCMLVCSHRQNKQFYATLAGLYPDGSDGRRKAFKKYVTACFPHQVRMEEQSSEQIRATLERVCQQGPMVIG